MKTLHAYLLTCFRQISEGIVSVIYYMKAAQNEFNLKVGDSIEWVNKLGAFCKLTITRIEENSVYCNSRRSWNTFNSYIKEGAKIIRP